MPLGPVRCTNLRTLASLRQRGSIRGIASKQARQGTVLGYCRVHWAHDQNKWRFSQPGGVQFQFSDEERQSSTTVLSVQASRSVNPTTPVLRAHEHCMGARSSNMLSILHGRVREGLREHCGPENGVRGVARNIPITIIFGT